MIINDKDAIEYWNERFQKDGDVGWGSRKGSDWYNKKKNAISNLLKQYSGSINNILDVCCGDMKFVKEIPQLKDFNYTSIEPTKSIYNQIVKEFPDTDIRHMSLQTILTSNINKEFDVVICYDVLFHIIDDKIYNDLLNWLFNKDVKFVVVTYDDVIVKSVSNDGHFIPRNFNLFEQTLKEWDVVYSDEAKRKPSQKLKVYRNLG